MTKSNFSSGITNALKGATKKGASRMGTYFSVSKDWIRLSLDNSHLKIKTVIDETEW